MSICDLRFMILATDGLWDVFSNQEAVNFISERLHESYFGAKSIVLQAFYRGSTDNISVMVVKFPRGNGHDEAEFEDDLEFFDTTEEIDDDDDDDVNESLPSTTSTSEPKVDSKLEL